MSQKVILKNTTVSEIRIEDLEGLRIPANGSYEATKSRSLMGIQQSAALKSMLESGYIIWNDGTKDYSAEVAAYLATTFAINLPFPYVCLISPDGTAFNVTVANDGTLSATEA